MKKMTNQFQGYCTWNDCSQYYEHNSFEKEYNANAGVKKLAVFVFNLSSEQSRVKNIIEIRK